MKNKRIHFDDRFYLTALSFVLALFFLLVSILIIISNGSIAICIIFGIMFLYGIFGCIIFPKMGIYFNYNLCLIIYLGSHNDKKRIIKMTEVIKIEFVEIPTLKGGGVAPKSQYAYCNVIDTTYRNGKIFKFILYLKNNDIIEIPYYNLFKARSKKRVMKQEERINEIIMEFNKFVQTK